MIGKNARVSFMQYLPKEPRKIGIKLCLGIALNSISAMAKKAYS